MRDDEFLNLLATAREVSMLESLRQEDQHEGRLTFQRASELAQLEVREWTEAERAHVKACPRCAQLIDQFRASSADMPTGTYDNHAGGATEQAGAGRPGKIHFLRRLIATGTFPVILNCIVSVTHATATPASRLDFWRLVQTSGWTVGALWGFISWLVIISIWLAWAVWSRRTSELNMRVAGLTVAASAALALILTASFIAFAEHKEREVAAKLDQLFINHHWVAFDSPSFDPDTNPSPDPEQLKKELKKLHDEGGFEGLITFTLFEPKDGDVANSLPRIAKEVGFQAMICGLGVTPDGARPDDQLRLAFEFERTTPEDENTLERENIVVGYCLGQNVPPNVPLEELAKWIQELRKGTGGKPVSSTFPVVAYLGERGKSIREIGDFWIPDVHAEWHLNASPQSALDETREALKDLTVLPADKPVMLKMVMFPSDGVPGASLESQKEFFDGVARDLYLPRGVHVSVFGYDTPWKGRLHRETGAFSAADEFAGLINADAQLTPKPALELIKNEWPVQSRP